MITIYQTGERFRVVSGPHLSLERFERVAFYYSTEDALNAEKHDGIREALRDIQCDEITARRRAEALRHE